MASFIMPALMIGSSLLQAKSKTQAGDIAQQESEVDAKQEELGAIQREADRKQRLAKSMASNIAGAGASGIKAFMGSPLAILQQEVKVEGVATERDKFNTTMKAESIRSTGTAKQTSANQSAAFGLMDSAFSVAKVWPSAGGGSASTPQINYGGR